MPKHTNLSEGRRELLRTAEMPSRYRLSMSFFNTARVKGDGPPFLKIGSAVLYDATEVDAWFAARRQRSTSETGR